MCAVDNAVEIERQEALGDYDIHYKHYGRSQLVLHVTCHIAALQQLLHVHVYSRLSNASYCL